MTVELNRKIIEVAPEIATLGQLLHVEKLDGTGVAAAVDGRLAPRSQWADVTLVEGMKITVIRAVCGG